MFELNAQWVGAQVGQDQGSQVWTPSWDTHMAGRPCQVVQRPDPNDRLQASPGCFVCLLMFRGSF